MKIKGNKQYEINEINRKWKEENKKYLAELQLFFDKVDNIQDESLKLNITRQMLICDKVLTEIAEEMFINYYNEGYKKAKQG